MISSGTLCSVAPLAGAWIEINKQRSEVYAYKVAPHAGAWIEILRKHSILIMGMADPHAGA